MMKNFYDKIYSNNFIFKIIKNDIKSKKYNYIHTRFPPEPNGYLHIGHAKSICLNFDIAKIYQGKCNLRFDDTNPVKEEKKYIAAIIEDIEWLGFKWDGTIKYTSDYFEQLYNYALELINKGLAYVDELSSEQISEYRGSLIEAGKESPYRNRSIKENIKYFIKMRHGEFAEGTACLRAKIDMQSPFMVMRDPILYRIKFSAHYKTENKWCIYPMYDFSHCISDALEGITHSLCTLEFQNNRYLYNWILKNLNLDHYPKQYEFSRLNMDHTIISKRQLKLLVTDNIVDGWDDPRMPTISGLRRRGYTASSIREFCRRIGITKQDHNIEFVSLESCIRKELNESAPRVMAVLNPVKILIENLPINYESYVIMKNHPQKMDMGIRKVAFSRELYIDRSDFCEAAHEEYKRLVLGHEVRLRYAYIIKAKRIEKDINGNITTIYCNLDPNSLNRDPIDGRKIKGVIHWVSVTNCIEADFRIYEKLFIVNNPSSFDNIIDLINPNSLKIFHGFVELELLNAKINQCFQFEREGYFCLDNAYQVISNKKLHLVFNRTVNLKERNNKSI